MFTDMTAKAVSELIQASLSPMFLLTAIGASLSVIDTRLNRIADHVRRLESGISATPEALGRAKEELAFYLHRAQAVGWAAACCIIAALCVASVVVMMFIDLQIHTSLAAPVEGAFTAAVLIYALALIIYLRDVLRVYRGLSYARGRVGIGFSARRDES